MKNVVITGASTGIGKACALWLADRGWRVFAGVRKPVDGEALQAADARLIPLILDVTKQEQIDAAVQTVTDAVGDDGLHGLVNNAGIAVGGPMEYIPVDRFQWQFDVNVTGAFAMSQAFMPLLRKAKGRIVNMSSISGRIAMPFFGPYAASKFALEAMSDSMRVEIMDFGMWVSVIEPGRIATPIWEKSHSDTESMFEGLPDEMWTYYEKPVKRLLKIIKQSHGPSPDIVAAKVEHALTSNRPRRRYMIGNDARLGYILTWLPGPIRDYLAKGAFQ